MDTCLNVVNHLVFGYLRDAEAASTGNIHTDIVNVVGNYIDAKSTYYYPPPIELKQLTQIIECDIDAGKVTIVSNDHLVIKEENKLSIKNVSTNEISSCHLKIDLVSVNTSKNIIALATKCSLEFYDSTLSTKIDTVHTIDVIKYCQWICDNTIVYITNSSIYHCAFSDNGTLNISTYFQQTPDIFCIKDLETDNKTVTFLFYIKQADSTIQLCAKELRFVNDNTNDIHSNIEFHDHTSNDYIVSMIASSKYDCIYLLSYYGTIFVFDTTLTEIYSKTMSLINHKLISMTLDLESGGIFVKESSTVIHISINTDTVVQYIIHTIGDTQRGIEWSKKFNLPGAESIFRAEFNELISGREFHAAAKLAVDAPSNTLRTAETINSFSNEASTQCLYYNYLLEKRRKLNKEESIGWCKYKLDAGAFHRMEEEVFQAGQLTYSEELGDLFFHYNKQLAKWTYDCIGCHNKVILCFIEMGQHYKIIPYCQDELYIPNWSQLLSKIENRHVENNVIQFAHEVVESGYLTVMEMINILWDEQKNHEKSIEFLLEYFEKKGNRKEDSELQTKIFDISLRSNPQVADAIFESEDFILTYFDRNYIARLCESVSLFNRAIKLYEDINDIKRVLQMGLATNMLKEHFLLTYFAELPSKDTLACFYDMLRYSESGNNLQIVAKAGAKCIEHIQPEKMLSLFEEIDCVFGTYLYLEEVINDTKDSKLILKYITVAVDVGNIEKIQLICRKNNYYDPVEVKSFLMQDKIKDPRPLIHVCHRYGYYNDLAKYLYSRKLYRFIKVYLNKMQPNVTPIFVGVILDMNPSYFMIRNCLKDEWMVNVICKYVFGNQTPRDHIHHILDLVRTDRYSVDELNKILYNRDLPKTFINVRIPIVTLPIGSRSTVRILVYGYLRETQATISSNIHLDIETVITDYYWVDPTAPISPIKLQSLLQLTQLGVHENDIKYTHITMESDKYIVVRRTDQIMIVTVETGHVTPLNVNVDAAIMNSSTQFLLLGLRLDERLQVFNLDMQTRTAYTETDDEILYWKWLDSETIAFITTKAIYHWNINSGIEPEKKIDVEWERTRVEIINYDSSKDSNWLFLQLITKKENDSRVIGILKIYNLVENSFHSETGVHGTCFAYININGYDTTLLCCARSDPQNENITNLCFTEIDNENNPFKVEQEIQFEHKHDFIVRMIPSSEYGCMYSISSAGTLFLNDIISGTLICKYQVSNTRMFLAVPHAATNGIQTFDKNGHVALFYVDRDDYVPYITKTIGNRKLGAQIAETYQLPCIQTNIPHFAPENEAVRQNLQYYTFLLKQGKLDKINSIGLCRLLLKLKLEQGKVKIEDFLKREKLTCSEELGILLARYDARLAAFSKANITAKTVLSFIQMGEFHKIIPYCQSVNYVPYCKNWSKLVSSVQQLKRDHVVQFAQKLVTENCLFVQDIVDVLSDSNLGGSDYEKTAEFLLEYLKKTETKSLKINLNALPKVVGVILDKNRDYFMIAKYIHNEWIREVIYEYVFGSKTIKDYIEELIDMVKEETYSVVQLIQEFKDRDLFVLSFEWLKKCVSRFV